MTAERWIIVALGVVLAAVLAFGGGHDDTFAEQQRAALQAAEDSADMAAQRAADLRAAYADSLQAARDSTAAVTRAAHQRVQAASRTAAKSAGRLRAVLDSLGASTAPLDSLVLAQRLKDEAHGREVAALRSELRVTRAALAASDSLVVRKDAQLAAVKAERDHLAQRLGLAEKRADRAERKSKIVTIIAGGVVVADAIARATGG